MRARLIASVLAVAQFVAGVVFLVAGSWPVAALLLVGAVAVAWLALILVRRAAGPPPPGRYVERSRVFW